jgi:hypothetical protein
MISGLKDKHSIVLALMALVGAGAVQWTIPYSEINMMDNPFLLRWGLICIFLGAIGSYYKKSTVRSALLITAGFIAAVIFRAIYDFFIDPSSHNLLPFEVGLTILIVFPPSFISTFALRPLPFALCPLKNFPSQKIVFPI